MSYISTFKNTWPVAFWLSVLSFILAFTPFLYSLIAFFPPSKLWGTWLFLIPFLCILFIFLIFFFLHKKFPIITNLIVVPIVLYIIFVVQICIGLILFSFLFCTNEEYKFDKPQYYEEVLEYFEKDKVAHFPKHIPESAKNIEMDGYYLSIFGSRSIFIKFDIEQSYIDRELKKYKFIKKDNANSNTFSYVSNHSNININDYDIYILNGELSRRGNCYGIGINKTKTQITYFYLDPD